MPYIAHLGILPQFGQNHLVVIEILPFSCSVLFLVMADGDHLAMPNYKKSKWLNAKIIDFCNTELVQFH